MVAKVFQNMTQQKPIYKRLINVLKLKFLSLYVKRCNESKREVADLGVENCNIYPKNDYYSEHKINFKSIFNKNNGIYSLIFNI